MQPCVEEKLSLCVQIVRKFLRGSKGERLRQSRWRDGGSCFVSVGGTSPMPRAYEQKEAFVVICGRALKHAAKSITLVAVA